MNPKSDGDLAGMVPGLLAWFDRSARTLPWRSPRGVARDPYRVWLSEIMLQQTTVPHAAPYFDAFTRRWPLRRTKRSCKPGPGSATMPGRATF